jgi:ElaB/YqjD/DUF883 family membrane-anchored ribosome-binding protein
MLSNAAKFASNTARDSADDVKADLKIVARKATEHLDETLDKASSYANEAGKKVRGVFDRTSDSVKGVTHTVTTEIKEKPIQSSLIALGAGYILGSLLRR